MAKALEIALFGATGMIGSRIAAEAARRGHQVTAFSRNPERVPTGIANLKSAQADVTDAASVASAARGHDVVASAYAPPMDNVALIGKATRALVEGTRAAGVKRLVVVGGAGSLEVAPGTQLVDTEGFPEAYKAIALAHRDVLPILRAAADLDWTFFAPAALIAPGERKGTFRTGAGALIVDAQGNSSISAEDYAIAFVDELEQGRFVHQLATAAY
ncbi:NAD(P)H-binding protein [Paraburkholderia sp. LEh10]|uniref:NAD(P)-dependent oxidoreductase n=1 Tax=Paraburkholderia sp. LEh10 TaxID=2821353 RepID=UPI001AEB87C1|nr:NAD(P)H-binding protein [Paraburkholderia sp. LEh10]MBP0589954.1 NAD(P)H-binding protein [Paraburkholderia sp. LEh10]